MTPVVNPSIAIVGGKGYLGSALHARCQKRDISSWVVGRENPLDIALKGASTVFHFATLTTPATGEASPMEDLENIAFTRALTLASAKAGVHHLIFASSGGTIYGPISKPATEETTANPICSYGKGKLASERCLEIFARESGTNVTILRISNVFGGDQVKKGNQGVISYLADQITHDRDVLLYGDTTRDYICIHDVVEAFNQTFLRPSGFKVYNISTGIGTSLVSLTKLIYKLMGKKERIAMAERRAFDVPYSVLRNDKARRELEWAPKHALEECLSVYLQQHGHLSAR